MFCQRVFRVLKSVWFEFGVCLELLRVFCQSLTCVKSCSECVVRVSHLLRVFKSVWLELEVC